MPIRGWIGHTCFYSSRLKTRHWRPASALLCLPLLNGHKSAGWRIELELDPALVKRNNAQ